MFVGEAPGRLGADRTAVPFHGDAAGDNFERLLALSGLARRDVFITNAVLCNPRDEKGNNAPPTRRILLNCADNLRRQIEVIQPAIVVTLGGAALEATRAIEDHQLALATHVRTINPWKNVQLIPLYHPGARAMIHRNFAAQSADYYFVGETVRRLARKPSTAKTKAAAGKDDSWAAVKYIVSQLKTLSLFRLHKAIYLSDYRHYVEAGSRLTDFVYIRQKDGPYCVELGSRWFKNYVDVIKPLMIDSVPHLRWIGDGLFSEIPKISNDHQFRIDQILSEIEKLSDAQLKTKAYLTAPMKDALKAERLGIRQLNRPLL
jgi:uracil-DNA glycosylase family 4